MLKYFKIIALLAFGYMNAQSEKWKPYILILINTALTANSNKPS
jgi:hypothetical protein